MWQGAYRAIGVDESHGLGEPYDPDFAQEVVRRSPLPVLLSGGLAPENVQEAIVSTRMRWMSAAESRNGRA